MNFNFKLIDLVSKNEILYNRYHCDRKDKLLVEKTWKTIAEKMKESGFKYSSGSWFVKIERSIGFTRNTYSIAFSWECAKTMDKPSN